MLSDDQVRWLQQALDDPGPFALTRLSGGNSNETIRLESAQGARILRRPPAHGIAPSAHNMEREARVLAALSGGDVRVPALLAYRSASNGHPSFIVMEMIDGVALTDALPEAYKSTPGAVRQIGEATVDQLAKLHSLNWRAAGLEGFGRPEGFLERQVGRWRAQYERSNVRELPDFELLARWLAANVPAGDEPALIHGDFHLDNCLMNPAPPIAVAAVIDWEMATIGDPLLDLGLLLAFWGSDRAEPPAIPAVQAVTRVPEAPSRDELLTRYAERSGRSVDGFEWYLALAFWKLAAIVEGAYAQHVRGKLTSDYARDLEHDVPRLLAEAVGFAGLR
jgi:aminoglycoside phosphotransferase (APT) family kinase protein